MESGPSVTKPTLVACLGGLVLMGDPAAAFGQSFTSIRVNSTDNLSGAGHPTNVAPNPGGGSGGTAASTYLLISGSGRVLTFQSVTGTISLSPGVITVPDGVNASGNAPFGVAMSVNPFGGVSGVALRNGSGFLAGVFLGPDYPNTPPSGLTFTNANGTGDGVVTSFASLSPAIGQIFFIGDGLSGTGSGQVQEFRVPDLATRLYLGFTDANGYSGPCGQFQDNFGYLTASFQVVACSPQITAGPTSVATCADGTITFSVTTAGTAPFTYQWRKDGSPIETATNPSATTATLTLSNITSADAASYDCIVTNACGSVTSNAAALTLAVKCSVADIVGTDGGPVQCADSTVDGSDFIAFINSFSIGDAAIDPLADIAGGGDTGEDPDGTIDGTDFIAFINAFAIGC
jgi:hypothetical protein